jgi:hypothetical protein
MPTDTERLDFLQKQGYTRWVGYGVWENNTTWPVFPGGDLRKEIDIAMERLQFWNKFYDEHPEMENPYRKSKYSINGNPSSISR